MKFVAAHTEGAPMFTAKFPGTCCDCLTAIVPGDSVAFSTGMFKGRKAIRHTDCPGVVSEYDAVCQQIKDAQTLQYNAVMMCDRSGRVSQLDTILEKLYARKAELNAGRCY